MKNALFEPPASPYLVPYDGSFRIGDSPTDPPKDVPREKELEKRLEKVNEEIDELQRQLYADDRYSLLLVFQAMDAAGKDGTIRAVMGGVDPAGCQVFSFKAPSGEELDHDFLWRVQRSLPERGRIGIFNRSHYEEVLVVRVHPEYLDGQKLPRRPRGDELWKERYDSIRDMERHLARNGTAIVKLFLNVSKKEQKKRFLKRIDEVHKNWKFNAGDVKERAYWDDYMHAYEDALNETSRPWAPWYAIPADDKDYMRLAVAEIVRDTLEAIPFEWPELPDHERARMADLREALTKED
jgi:PPK2 family polyphosphate:nucleotide phosphotransferase